MFSRLYSKWRVYHNELLWLALSIVAILIFVALHPVVMLKWNEGLAKKRAETWLEKAKVTQTVNSAEWWEFRALYDPGSFEYNPQHLAVFSILQLQNLSLTEPNELFQYYPKDGPLSSVEYLVVASEVEKLRQSTLHRQGNIEWVVQQPDTLVGVEGNQTILWMSRPLSEMKQVNGLINYEDPDKVLERNDWRWLTIAEWYQ